MRRVTGEVLGLQIGDGESGVFLVGTVRLAQEAGPVWRRPGDPDDHAGLAAAVKKQFQGASWQRCQTHFSGNVLDACPEKERVALKARLRRIFEAADPQRWRVELAETLSAFWARPPVT